MKLFVGVTDYDWYRYFLKRPHLTEANFWQPSAARRFRALDRYEPFLFKLHAPRNFIVGGGFFTHYTQLPYRTAWEFFGEANGAASIGQMRDRIEKYRRGPIDRFGDYHIGCIILNELFLFEEHDWIPVPEDWKPNIVQGKTYDTGELLGAELWQRVQSRLQALQVGESAREPRRAPGSPPSAHQGVMFSEGSITRRRLGQGTFRALITDEYERRCAISGEKALPVLEAAHIRPVADGGAHDASNGLLLRSDIHRLYDLGYVTVAPDLSFRVSRRLKDEFDNGEPYYPLAGQKIREPRSEWARPQRELLEWHSDVIFRS